MSEASIVAWANNPLSPINRGDQGGAKSCGCDTTINHECDRHTIDRLEREVAERGKVLAAIEFEARLGYMRCSAPAREGFRRIFDQAKGYSDTQTANGADQSAVSKGALLHK